MSLSKPVGLLFDKDGTLLDYTATYAAANVTVAHLLAGQDQTLARDLLTRGGHDFDLGRPRSGSILASGTLDDFVEMWQRPTLETYDWPTDEPAVVHIDRLFQTHMTPTAVGDVAGLFDRFLDQGLKLGVATADSEAGMLFSLAGLEILERCVYAAGFDTGDGCKPGPGMVNAFGARIGAAPSEVWVVGDNASDICMGLNAGATTIGVLTGTSSHEELRAVGAHHVLPSIHDLPSLLAA